MNKPTHTWNNEIRELEEFFASRTLPEKVRLNSWSIIVDTRLFVEFHMSMVKAHNGNDLFLPYIERLFELKRILTK
jgi:hypothetical protein